MIWTNFERNIYLLDKWAIANILSSHLETTYIPFQKNLFIGFYTGKNLHKATKVLSLFWTMIPHSEE
mgnify:CR=1 FL=1